MYSGGIRRLTKGRSPDSVHMLLMVLLRPVPLPQLVTTMSCLGSLPLSVDVLPRGATRLQGVQLHAT